MDLIFQIKIEKSGRISLPPEILSELHLVPGKTLLLEEKNGKISLEPINEEPELIEKDGLLIVRPKITGDIVQSVQQNRVKRISKLVEEFSE